MTEEREREREKESEMVMRRHAVFDDNEKKKVPEQTLWRQSLRQQGNLRTHSILFYHFLAQR